MLTDIDVGQLAPKTHHLDGKFSEAKTRPKVPPHPRSANKKTFKSSQLSVHHVVIGGCRMRISVGQEPALDIQPLLVSGDGRKDAYYRDG